MAIGLLRHTTPAIPSGICYGQLDVDVAGTFIAEASAALDALTFKPEQIITSPLKRCKKLADFIGKNLSLSLTVNAHFAEMDFGAWEGVAWDDIPRAELDAWAADFAHARPHGGESVATLKARVDRALRPIKAAGQSTLIITHAGVIKAAKAPSLHEDDFAKSIAFGALDMLLA